ncbi:hypothetical protein ACHAWF_004066, partial [Thalassiosira exigua]
PSATATAALEAPAAADDAAASVREGADQQVVPESIRELLPTTLSRLTSGLPVHELDTIIKEAKACEDALEREIETLEAELGVGAKRRKTDDDDRKEAPKVDEAHPSSPLKEPTMISIPFLPAPYQPGGEPGKGHVNYLDDVDAMLATEFAPPDRYFTVSALLGRLRDPMKLSHPPNARVRASKKPGPRGKKAETPEQEEKRKRAALEKQRALLALEANEVYRREQPDTAALLALYKKISSHRTATVFRKPVNPAEAPGYTERILFPMDLSLIRKMIVARMIKSFSSLHQRVGLICHNCVKFNGRESDYAVITRDFEDHVDDKVLEAVKNASATYGTTAAASGTAAAAGAASAGK